MFNVFLQLGAGNENAGFVHQLSLKTARFSLLTGLVVTHFNESGSFLHIIAWC